MQIVYVFSFTFHQCYCHSLLQPNAGAGEKLEEEFTVARLYISKMKSEVKTLAGRASTLETQYAENAKKLDEAESELSENKLKLQQVGPLVSENKLKLQQVDRLVSEAWFTKPLSYVVMESEHFILFVVFLLSDAFT